MKKMQLGLVVDRASGRLGSAGSCESVKFDTNDVGYSEVCGKVV